MEDLKELQASGAHRALGLSLPPPLPPPANAIVPTGGARRANEDDEAKRLRRVMASRQYSKRYRVKQQQSIQQLESKVEELQDEITANIPKIKNTEQLKWILKMENESMKQKISLLSQQLQSKLGLYGEMKKEKEMLKRIQWEQQQQQQVELIQENLNDNSQEINEAFNPLDPNFVLPQPAPAPALALAPAQEPAPEPELAPLPPELEIPDAPYLF